MNQASEIRYGTFSDNIMILQSFELDLVCIKAVQRYVAWVVEMFTPTQVPSGKKYQGDLE